MRIWIGKSLIVIGLIHSFFGFVVFRGIIGDIFSEMLFNTINVNTINDSQLDRHTAFWFLFLGFALLILGGLIDWAECKNCELPSFLKWSFLAFTVFGCFIIPVSGFWLLLVPTIGLFIRGYREIAAKAS
jgi:hypothetical protein